MSGINLSSYENLSKYGILAAGSLTSNPTGNTITVNSGNWYGTPIGILTSGTAPTGLNNTDSALALTQLNTLITDINTVTSGLSLSENLGSGGGNKTFYPGINYYGIGITYATSETLTFNALGDPNAQFFITDNGTGITFSSATFILTGEAQPCNIFWLANNATTGAFSATNSSVPGTIITKADFTTTSNAAPAITFTGHIFSKGAATLTCSGAGPLSINTSTCPIVCYLKGTLILTDKGLVPIENIRAGDKVVTKGKIYRNKFIHEEAPLLVEPVFWVSKFKVTSLNSKSRPICIKKDALGKNAPFKDLYVSPGHSLLLNGKMVLAKNIVNGNTIYQDKECDNIEYYHLECDRHSAIFANGVLSESYLDVNNRDVFENSIRLKRKVNFKKMNYLKM